jgi:hypothetical protein
MKTTKPATVHQIKAIRGFAGEDGKNVKPGEVVKCKTGFAKTMVACGRAVIVEAKAAQ